MKENDKQYFPALTGIRAISVWFIFIIHFNPFEKYSFPWYVSEQFFSFLSFFFVLSGFLITYRYLSVGSLQYKDLKKYFVFRFARVFPVLFILTTLTFFLKYWSDHQSISTLIKPYIYNITLLKGFSQDYYLTGIGPSWSLSVEELFYINAPILYHFIKKPSGLIRFVLISYSIAVLCVMLFWLIPFDGFFENYHFTFATTFMGRAFEFACGIYLAYILHGRFQTNYFSKIKFPTYVGSCIILIALIIQTFIAYHFNINNALNTWSGLTVNHILLPIGIVVLFYGLIKERTPLQFILSRPLFVHLGESTYSFYLLHTSFVAGWIAHYISQNFAIILISMVVIAYGFYQWVEKPLARLIRKWA